MHENETSGVVKKMMAQMNASFMPKLYAYIFNFRI